MKREAILNQFSTALHPDAAARLKMLFTRGRRENGRMADTIPTRWSDKDPSGTSPKEVPEMRCPESTK
jgi:hypothetical protein